jgi:hypothetical protein
MKYYLNKNDSEHGPFSIDELKDLDIGTETLIRSEDSSEWNQACDVSELYNLLFDSEEELIKAKPKPLKKSISLRIFIRDLLAILLIIVIIRLVFTFFLSDKFNDLVFLEKLSVIIIGSAYIYAIIVVIPVLLAIIIYIVKKEIKSWLVGLTWIIFAIITFLQLLSKAFIPQNIY